MKVLMFLVTTFRTEGVLSFCAVSFVFSQSCQRNCVVLKFNLVNPGTKILVVAARRGRDAQKQLVRTSLNHKPLFRTVEHIHMYLL